MAQAEQGASSVDSGRDSPVDFRASQFRERNGATWPAHAAAKHTTKLGRGPDSDGSQPTRFQRRDQGAS